MQEKQWNIYQTARKRSGFSQEIAAEVLNISTESIRAYETDRTVPPNETVAMMADVYDAPWLKVEHLRRSSEALQVLPEVNVQELPTASIALCNRMRSFADIMEALLIIAEDGKVSDNEQSAFEDITDELQALIAAAYQVIYAVGIKKERPEAGTSKRSSSQMRTNCNSYYSTPATFCKPFFEEVSK